MKELIYLCLNMWCIGIFTTFIMPSFINKDGVLLILWLVGMTLSIYAGISNFTAVVGLIQ